MRPAQGSDRLARLMAAGWFDASPLRTYTLHGAQTCDGPAVFCWMVGCFVSSLASTQGQESKLTRHACKRDRETAPLCYYYWV